MAVTLGKKCRTSAVAFRKHEYRNALIRHVKSDGVMETGAERDTHKHTTRRNDWKRISVAETQPTTAKCPQSGPGAGHLLGFVH